MQKRSYLIVTASIGSGHIKAAEAIGNEIKRKYPAADIRIVDFMSRETAWIHWLMKKIYLKMLAFVPNLYEFLYKFSGGHASGSTVQMLFSLVMQRTMAKLLDHYKPDVLICTHPFPEGAASRLKCSGKADFFFAVVMTDYSVHQIWLYPGVDRYFVATEKMRQDLLAAGFSADTIQVTGIPIAYREDEQSARELLLDKFGLRADIPVLLLMGGGLGLGGVDFALSELEKLSRPLQILVVAGRNAALLERVKDLAGRSRHKVLVWGYTGEVPAFLRMASLLISKPGALTISEAFARGVPMLLHEPIPGPETENAVYASEQGAAVWVRSDDELALTAESLLQEPARLAAMRENALACSRPAAAGEIVDALQALKE